MQQELEEYVVTKELTKHFAVFFESYAAGIHQRTDDMGVWISGYFGSGKSHFLKILAYLLDNREVNGKRTIDYFKDGQKIADSTIIANMERAAQFPTDTILFNIDSISSLRGNQKEAILPIFRKAFNKHLGYSGNPYVAELERRLDRNGDFEAFKQRFAEKVGESWEKSRDEIYFIGDEIISTLAENGFMSENAAKDWYEQSSQEFSDSIQDFTKLLKNYLDGKGKDHQIVFLADEVGQYIGSDSSLMLNLQTLVEDIGTVCGSQVWVIVTSQQDVDEITKVQGNDFSKIQGRFKTRLSLSSSNVEEVIRKRILQKTETAESVLTAIYENNQTPLRNLINFRNDAELKTFDSSKTFADIYPFVPYQIDLMQKSLTSIRKHSSSGKHLSDGERSMLTLFQNSAQTLKDGEEGRLVPFRFFYDAVENFLDHNHRMVVSHAEENKHLNPNGESDCFAVNILKTLFLIKYIEEFDPSLENIVTLMVSDIHGDRGLLTEKVRGGLEQLVKEALVLKHNGKFYFQTDAEQDTMRRIRDMEVSLQETAEEIRKEIFNESELYPVSKYRYSAQNSFPFQQKIDGYVMSGTGQIGINVITPDNPNRFEMIQAIGPCLYLVLPRDDRRFIEELEYALKIGKYLLQTSGIQGVDTQIRKSKSQEMQERLENVKAMLKAAMMSARIYSNGAELGVTGNTVADRLNQAMRQLVERVFFKLEYIRDAKSENDIKAVLRSRQQESLSREISDLPNGTALEEMHAYVQDNTSERKKLTLKEILAHFSEPPYGYAESDTEWLLAQLFTAGELEFSFNGEIITPEPNNAEQNFNYLTKRVNREILLIRRSEKSTAGQRRALQEIAEELFGRLQPETDDYTLQRNFQETLKGFCEELEKILRRREGHKHYPGKEVVQTGLNFLNELLDARGIPEFFAKAVELKDPILDFADDYGELKNFYGKDSRQPGIIDEAEEILRRYAQCRSHIDDAELSGTAAEIQKLLGRGPVISEIHKLPPLTEKFNKHYQDLINEKRAPILEDLEKTIAEINAQLEENGVPNPETIRGEIEIFRNDLERCADVAQISSFEGSLYQMRDRLNARIKEAAAPAVPGAPPAPREKTLLARNCSGGAWRLESESDVERCIEAFRKKLTESLEPGTVIRLEF